MLIALLLVFASGFAALVYQVLWMKQLGLLLGNTSHAAAVTLAAFFAGLAVGSWLWGKRSGRMTNPLRSYAWLEVGIAVTATTYFVILWLYQAIYPALYQSVDSPIMLQVVRFVLAMLLVFPPAMFMGGTIPIMGQFLIRVEQGRRATTFGKTGALLYAINTFGAALGALMAGFYMPLWLGYNLTCVVAIVVTLVTAAVAWIISRRLSDQQHNPASNPENQHQRGGEQPPLDSSPASVALKERLPLGIICFISGFGFLALEVLWTRMFMQVLENSVYTFASILVIVLLCLAAGGVVGSGLARLRVPPLRVLGVLMLLSGLAIALTPYLFMLATDRMQIIATRDSWSSYIVLIFQTGFHAIGLPALILGIVFPFLLKTEERYVRVAGQSIGRLAALNTIGAILGAMLCGFVFLGWLGMWGTMLLLSMVYLAAGLMLPLGWDRKALLLRGGNVAAAVLVLVFLNPTGLPIMGRDPLRPGYEQVVEVWEGSDGIVAVTRGHYGLMIRVNSHYGLGTSGAAAQAEFQNDLMLRLFPQTRSIFFLGMGTGVTAGSSLHPVFPNTERIVVCELSANVITAAKQYFADEQTHDYTNGLFEDPRATILAEDGRHYLMATDQRFDMINADLFVPFRSGVGSLYTRDHYENARQRLTEDGVFVQWLPLYQLTEYEFSVIARTMLEVFDQVTLWRGNFQPFDETVALVGQMDQQPLPGTDVHSRADMLAAVRGRGIADLARLALPFNEQTALLFYIGNLTQAAAMFDDYPINTDDRPVIEYMAPVSYRIGGNSMDTSWFIGHKFADFVQRLQTQSPPQVDPYLINRSASDRLLPLAGSAYYDARFWFAARQPMEAEMAWRQFLELWLAQPSP